MKNKKVYLQWPMQEGFTLIEMMLVMAVIGILTAISVPSFSKVQVKAKELAVQSATQSIQLALETYYLDQGTYPQASSMGTLLDLLLNNGDLKTIPKNPFTGDHFSDLDESGLIQYEESSGSYELSVYGKNNSKELLRLTGT